MLLYDDDDVDDDDDDNAAAYEKEKGIENKEPIKSNMLIWRIRERTCKVLSLLFGGSH